MLKSAFYKNEFELKNKFFNLGVIVNLISSKQPKLFYGAYRENNSLFVMFLQDNKKKYIGKERFLANKIRNQRPLLLKTIIENIEFHINNLDKENKILFTKYLDDVKKHISSEELEKIVLSFCVPKRIHENMLKGDNQLFEAIIHDNRELVKLDENGIEIIRMQNPFESEFSVIRFLSSVKGTREILHEEYDENYIRPVYKVEVKKDEFIFKGFVHEHKENDKVYYTLDMKANYSIELNLYRKRVKIKEGKINPFIVRYIADIIPDIEYPRLNSDISWEDYISENFIQKANVIFQFGSNADNTNLTINFKNKKGYYLSYEIHGIILDYENEEEHELYKLPDKIFDEDYTDIKYIGFDLSSNLTKELLDKITENNNIFYFRTISHEVIDMIGTIKRTTYKFKIYRVKKDSDNYIVTCMYGGDKETILSEKEMLEYKEIKYLFVR